MDWGRWTEGESTQQPNYQLPWNPSDMRIGYGAAEGGWKGTPVHMAPAQQIRDAPPMEYRNWAAPIPGEYDGGRAGMPDFEYKQYQQWEQDGDRMGYGKGGPQAPTSLYTPQAGQQQWQEYNPPTHPHKTEYSYQQTHPAGWHMMMMPTPERYSVTGLGYQALTQTEGMSGPVQAEGTWNQHNPEWKPQLV